MTTTATYTETIHTIAAQLRDTGIIADYQRFGDETGHANLARLKTHRGYAIIASTNTHDTTAWTVYGPHDRGLVDPLADGSCPTPQALDTLRGLAERY